MENRITKETVDEIRAAHATITKAKKEYEAMELPIRNQHIRFKNSVKEIICDPAVDGYMRMKIRHRNKRKADEIETEFYFNLGNGFVEIHGVWESFSGGCYWSEDGFMIPFDALPDIAQRNGNDIFKEYYVRNIRDFKNNITKGGGNAVSQ